MAKRSSGVTQCLYPFNEKKVSDLVQDKLLVAEGASNNLKNGYPDHETIIQNRGINVTLKMSSTSKGSMRPASSEKSIPHTRIEDESHMEQVYTLGAGLGEGTFGVVREVIHKDSGERWACKMVSKEKAGNPKIKLLEREVTILKKVYHEHIIQLKEIFETPKKMFFIMELCDKGELADVLKEKGSFTEEESLRIIKRLANAVAYLHKNGMVHRDIKLENILLKINPKDSSDDLYIKLTDFGLSVTKSGAGIDNLLEDFCGTPLYMSPEIIDNNPYTEKCDVWAMGIIAFMLLCGHPPFNAKDEETLQGMIRNANIKDIIANDSSWENISEEAKNCVEGMLNVETTHRLTSAEILDHPWITGEPLSSMRQENVLDLMKQFRREFQATSDEDEDATTSTTKVEVQENGTRSSLPSDSQPKAASRASPSASISKQPARPKKSPQNSADKTGHSKKTSVNSPSTKAHPPAATHTHHPRGHTSNVPPATKTATTNGLGKSPSENHVVRKKKELK